MSHLPHAVPTSLPYIRDSVNARSITPVKPTRWFLVPDSTPCSERKRRHSGTVQGQTKLIPKKQRCNYSPWPVATIRVFAGSECSGEKGDHIRLSPKRDSALFKLIHLLLLDLLIPVFFFTASSSPPIIHRQISIQRHFRRMADTQKPMEHETRSKENAWTQS